MAARERMENRIGRLLLRRSLNPVTVESCTGGLLADRITNIPGSSAYYLGGFITYANAAKVALVQVPADIFKTYYAVSAETAGAMMAKGGRQGFFHFRTVADPALPFHHRHRWTG
jgi:PncC family amidohydrolase